MISFDWQAIIQLICIIVVLSCITNIINRLSRPPLPPGPPTLPLIGNLHQLPESKASQWKKFDEWKQKYGPIFRVLAGRYTMIVLADWEVAHELLNRRAANFSSKPDLPMANGLIFRGMHPGLRPYDQAYKLHRRMMEQFFTVTSSQNYVPLQDMESIRLLRLLREHCEKRDGDSTPTNTSVDEPQGKSRFPTFEAFAFATYRYTASIMYMLIYGFRIETGNEIEIQKATIVNEHFLESLKQVWPCDILPILNRLPSWLAPWKRTAKEWYEYERDHHLEDLARGKSSPGWNLIKAMLGSREARSMSQLEISYDAGVIGDAGIDTTAYTLTMFLMVAATNPDQVKRAQQEIDEVVGQGRLPNIGDKKSLPYVNAFISEVMRWRTIIPGGLPHSNLKEEVYKGFRIPAGSFIVSVLWSIHMDKATYGDPEVFRPKRWLDNPGLPNVSFGFGRRTCVGQHVARNSLFLGVSRLLWAFDIKKKVDEVEIDSLSFPDQILVRPNAFPVDMTVRNGEVEKVIEDAWKACKIDAESLMGKIGQNFAK